MKNFRGRINDVWNFKLKKTRIIFLLSIIWCGFVYLFFIDGWIVFLLDWQTYNNLIKLDYFNGSMSEWLFWLTPVWIYWITIPIIRIAYKWIKGGV